MSSLKENPNLKEVSPTNHNATMASIGSSIERIRLINCSANVAKGNDHPRMTIRE
jgi:hypothetical protein